MKSRFKIALGGFLASVLLSGAADGPLGAIVSPQATGVAAPRALIDRYCVSCHNDKTKTAGLALDLLDPGAVDTHRESWEKVVRKLRTRVMPPVGMPRPDEAAYTAVVEYLETALDRAAAAQPDPGPTSNLRRLNATEYQNAIRDLLELEIDATSLLPKEDASHGFDSVNVQGLSPTLLERHLGAARKIARMALGSLSASAENHIVVLPVELTQEAHLDGLPLGTRGGTIVQHQFSRDGDYSIQVRLQRNRNENVEGLSEPHTMEVNLDGQRIALFTIAPDRKQDGLYYSDVDVDKNLVARIPVRAGPHEITVTFFRKTPALLQTDRQPYVARFNMNRHPRTTPAVYSVAIAGPFDATTSGDTPSRRRILTCHPVSSAAETGCARTILSQLGRRAYRRPLTTADVDRLMELYRQGTNEGGFEAGIETALRALLSSTEFLFRVERPPSGVRPNITYRISGVELASRLSFFLWSSIPDDQLLDLAASGKLSDRAVLEAQVRRMLADPRSESLVTNFASQWLYLRNLAAASPNARLFPDFDDNLRQAMRRETELFFESVVREDRNVLDLLSADYTFLNERLAKHYDIPNIYGDRFRRVALSPSSPRRGLLGQAGILTVTSYATRTSPVLRGRWMLENILGVQVPPPPPNVPALEGADTGSKARSMRERMAQHRENPVCAGCHNLMDPLGLVSENFDAVGRWRTRDTNGAAFDVKGNLPGGAAFDGVAGLRQAVADRPDLFVNTLTEKLLTYALGRGLEYQDAAAVRAIRREARRSDNHFSAIILGIVNSVPFQMRMSPS